MVVVMGIVSIMDWYFAYNYCIGDYRHYRQQDKKENMEEWENKMVDLMMYQRDCVDAFRMEFSKEDIKHNSEVKKLAKFINRQGRKIDRINKMRRSVLGYK